MSFADNWLTLVSQGYLAFESAAQTPALRVQAKRMRFGAMSSAVEIATIPIILIGVWVIEFTKPDISEIEEMAAEFQGFSSAQKNE